MNTRRGFTIVELVVVIMIIVALALITVFAFGSWRQRTARTEMKNELNVVSSALKNHLNFNNSYPATLTGLTYQANPNVSITYTLRSGGASYCLDAGSLSVTDEPHWYYDSSGTGGITKTACT